MIAARIAIEGLRAGVPNGEAIRRLGGGDPVIEAGFAAALDSVFGEQRGMPVISGGFGTGKSHMLRYLRELGLQRNFIVSTVAVSKETPLNVPGHMFAAALRHAAASGFNDDPVALALQRVEHREGALQALEAVAAEAGLAPIFSALLHLLSRPIDPELHRGIEIFLAGGKAPMPAIRRALREAGTRTLFDLAMPAAAELARQRLRFIPALFRAAGFAGWVVLIDEVELIGRYGPLQRALAYVELAKWLGLDETRRIPGLCAAAAITDDFADMVINARQDDEKLPERLRQKGLPNAADLAAAAIAAIERATRLRAPDDAALRTHAETVRRCYAEAYAWPAPPAEIAPRAANRTIRKHVRGWIAQWDMLRTANLRTGITDASVASDYREDPMLLEPPPEDDDPV
jgi:hypothetical protein